MALEHYKTQILLLHSEQSTLDSLSTGFNDRYSVHCATSGTEALNTLTETPINVIVSAQDLPGMSGLDAIREAKKRSPDTIGILLASGDQQDGLEALVGDKEVYQIVRGEITPEALRELIDNATKKVRLIALSESANDNAANVDEPVAEHIVMETSENGSTIISDGTGTLPALKPQKVQISPTAGGRTIDVLVLTKDEEFLATIKDSSRGLHNVHHATTPTQAEDIVGNHKVGVLVTDAAMVGSNIEILTQRLRAGAPRMVAVVAGRRDDGELLMDLINRGQVYRFLLKPVSPGRARLAIEASVKHHLEAADSAFKNAAPAPQPAAKIPTVKKPARKPVRKSKAAPQQEPDVSDTGIRKAPTISSMPSPIAAMENELDAAFSDDTSFTETMTGIVIKVGKSISDAKDSIVGRQDEKSTPAASDPDYMDIGTGGDLASGFSNSKILAVAGAAVMAGLLGAWLFAGSDDAPPAAGTAELAVQSSPSVIEEELALPDPVPAPEITQPPYEDILEEARFARDAGQLITPQGSSALELYVAAVAASSGDPLVAAEFDAIVNDVFGMVELALLDQRIGDAETALNAVRSASPASPRLSFLDAQLSQLKFRNAVDEARVAIRDNRFEDAGRWLSQAQAVRGADIDELNLLSEELATVRSEQRVEEVIALASQRLEDGLLTSPSNDNARYYYELAISNDPGNTAAQQGLFIVAGKLVIDARTAIAEGRFDDAEGLLADARQLDPSSAELAASSSSLETARSDQVQAQQQAESEQLATEARAEAQRQAAAQEEADRLAAIERETAAKQAEEDRRVAAAALAAAAVTASADEAAAQATEVQSVNTQQADSRPESDESSPPQSGPATDENSSTPETDLLAAATAASVGLGNSEKADSTTPAPSAPQAAIGAPVQQAQEVGAAPTPTPPSGPERVGISSLTRTNYVAPRYPRNAMRRNLNGSVDLGFTVATDGTVYKVEVLESTPGTVFDQAAIDAVSEWRFAPPIENGSPVEKITAVRMAFNLE